MAGEHAPGRIGTLKAVQRLSLDVLACPVADAEEGQEALRGKPLGPRPTPGETQLLHRDASLEEVAECVDKVPPRADPEELQRVSGDCGWCAADVLVGGPELPPLLLERGQVRLTESVHLR
jgi:hypothetical protein